MNCEFNLPVEKYWDFPAKYTTEQKAEEIKHYINSNDYIGSEKIDGHYSRMVIDAEGEIRLESRTVSKITGENGNKAFHVPHITSVLQKRFPKETILIGELYFPGKTSQEVGKILLCKPDKAVSRQEKEFGNLRYYIHDVWYYGGKDYTAVPYEERAQFVESLAFEDPYISFAKHTGVPAEIDELLEEVFARDGEGIVLLRKDAIVEPGKRPARKSIKVKRELDHHIDCFFTGRYKLPTRLYSGKELENWQYWENIKTEAKLSGDYYDDYASGEPIEPVTKSYFHGWAGSLELGIIKEGKPEVLGYISGMSDEVKQEISQNPGKYEDLPCEVTAMQFTDDMKLRHPKFVRFRRDINKEDCLWEKVF